MYSEQISERFKALNYAGEIAGATICRIGDVATGGVLEFFVKLDGDKVAEVRFLAEAEPISMCAADFLCQWLEGRELVELENFDIKLIQQELGLAPSQLVRAQLALDGLLNIRG